MPIKKPPLRKGAIPLKPFFNQFFKFNVSLCVNDRCRSHSVTLFFIPLTRILTAGGPKTHAIQGRTEATPGLFQRIPNFAETQVSEIFDVGGGEVRHPVMLQNQGKPNIENTTEGKTRLSGNPPELIVKVPFFPGESGYPPSRMSTPVMDDVNSFSRFQWHLQDGGVAQQTVKLDQHELRENDPAIL